VERVVALRRAYGGKQQSPAPIDGRIAALAAKQHGLATSSQLISLGLGRHAIEARVRSGRLHRVHRGVYAVGHRAPHPHTTMHAAVLAVGPDAVLSHGSAAVLWALVRPPARCPVDVTATRAVRSGSGVRVHRTRALPPSDTTSVQGIPVTTPARTLLDLSGGVPADVLRRALREAEVQRLVDHPALAAQLQRAPAIGRRGAGQLRRLLERGPAPTRSELEDRTLDLLQRHRFPPPQINVPVGAGGRTYEADFLFADQRVIVEADGAAYHDTPLARVEDAARQAALEAAGYRVIRVTWDQVTRDGDTAQTVERLSRALRAPLSTRSAPPPRRRRVAPRPGRPAASGPE
jgi:very-short-patch-repair endonuclease